MNQVQSHPGRMSGLSADAFSSLFQAIGGLRNLRAAVAMLGCLFTGILIAGLLAALFGRFGTWAFGLAGIVFLVAYVMAVNACGILLLDQARGLPPRGLSDALIYGLICVPKLIFLVVLLLVVCALMFLAIAILLFFCKVPVLGPLLFTVVFPLCVVLAGATFFWLFFGGNLACVALWDGATVIRAVAQSIAIARTRLMESMLLQGVVLVLASAVSLVVFLVLGLGLLPTMAMSQSIVGAGIGDVASILASFGSGGGYGIAGAIGTGLLWAVAVTLVTQVYLLGLELVYLRVIEGLDSSAAEQTLTEHIDTARRRAAELGDKAKEAAERAREQGRRAAGPVAAVAQVQVSSQAAPAGRLTSACPQCRKPVTDRDVFCGECGFKIA